jgi:hypothetical protein
MLIVVDNKSLILDQFLNHFISSALCGKQTSEDTQRAAGNVCTGYQLKFYINLNYIRYQHERSFDNILLLQII